MSKRPVWNCVGLFLVYFGVIKALYIGHRASHCNFMSFLKPKFDGSGLKITVHGPRGLKQSALTFLSVFMNRELLPMLNALLIVANEANITMK